MSYCSYCSPYIFDCANKYSKTKKYLRIVSSLILQTYEQSEENFTPDSGDEGAEIIEIMT